jgi:hypothetical protein
MEVALPRPIEQLLAVANTRHGPAGHWHARVLGDGPDHDHLAEPGDAIDFLGRHGVPVPTGRPPASDLRDLAILAREVRRLAEEPALDWPTRPVGRLLERASYRLDGAQRLNARSASPWRALVEDLLPAAVALGERRRDLRACSNRPCRFLFLDRSRNRSRRWCDPAGCGNRTKVRRFRRRQASGSRSGLSRTQPITTRTSRSTTSSIGRRSGR